MIPKSPRGRVQLQKMIGSGVGKIDQKIYCHTGLKFVHLKKGRDPTNKEGTRSHEQLKLQGRFVL